MSFVAHIWDISVGVLPIQLVLMVSDSLEVFLVDLLGMQQDYDIDLCIDFMLCIHSISISSYRMALDKLRELKVHLQNLHSKGFIYLSASF